MHILLATATLGDDVLHVADPMEGVRSAVDFNSGISSLASSGLGSGSGSGYGVTVEFGIGVRIVSLCSCCHNAPARQVLD